MRKLFLLVSIVLLFQSCFTYRKIDNEPSKMVEGRKYKIDYNHKSKIVVFKRLNDSMAIVSRKGSERQIALKDITRIKERKFSIIKTVVLVPATMLAMAGLFALTYSGPQIGEITMNK